MTDPKRELEELRAELARIDGQMLTGLEKRAKLSRRVGELRSGQPPQLPLNDRTQISALVGRTNGDMKVEDVRLVFDRVFAACTALELPVKVAYLGPEGGFAHAAARAKFGAGQLLPCDGVVALLEEVSSHRAEFAVLPIETTTEGPVQSSIFALVATELKIVSEVESASDLSLMNRTGNEADVEKVYATAADHARAQRALAALSRKPSIYDVKTPLIACGLAKEDHGAAALCSELFGVEAELQSARTGMVDGGAERVRYAVVSARPGGRTGDDATACVFSVKDAPGALLDVLRLFAERGINLRKIQSRPAPGEEWTYLFFVELGGHATDRPLVSAFEEVRQKTRFFKVLGSYPSA